MPDEVFAVKGVRKTCRSYAQKIGVLWPLMGRRSLTDDAVIADVQELQKRWRTKLKALQERGWIELAGPGQLQFARNCPPEILSLATDKVVRPCRMTWVCPWCYMRKAGTLFDKFAELLPKKGGFRDRTLSLLEVSGGMLLNRADTGRYVSGPLLEWQAVPKRLLLRLKPLGGFRTVLLDPKAVSGQTSAWRFVYRILAMVPEDYVIPDWLDNGRRKVRLHFLKSKKELVNVIARVCRYPVGLMRGDPRMVIMALNARRGKRCNEFTGCFRGTHDCDANRQEAGN